MIVNIYAVFDSKADAFLPPFYQPTKGMAIRQFIDVCNDPKTEFHRHPEDYALYALGTFNDADGTFETNGRPNVLLINAVECLKVKEPDPLST